MNKKKEDENELLRAGPLNRENGFHLIRMHRYHQALFSFGEALKVEPEDIHTIMGRANANNRMMYIDKGMQDIEMVLQLDEENKGALQMRAQQAYLCCNFEVALMLNERGAPLRSQPPVFQQGIMQCQEAVECCIGPKAGHGLRDFCGVIKRLEAKKRREYELALKSKWKRKDDPKKAKAKAKKRKKGHETMQPTKSTKSVRSDVKKDDDDTESQAGGIQEQHQMETELAPADYTTAYRPLQAKTTNIKNLVAEKYLERMCKDKLLLEVLAKDSRMKNPNKKGCVALNQLSKCGYNQLVRLQECLRTRRPFYAIRYHETECTKSLTSKQNRELMILQGMCKTEADNLLILLRRAREEKNIRLCQDISDRAKTFFDSKSKKVLPRKDEYMEVMYNIVGLANLDTKRLDLEGLSYEQEKRCLYMLGLPLSREPSKDSLVKAMKPVFADVKKLISVCETRIKNAKTPLELCWLYYDLSRYLIEQKKYELGRHYAFRCMEQADYINNEVWGINGSFLVVKVYVLQRNRNEAKVEVYQTLDRSRKINYANSENLVAFVKKCLQVIEECDFDEIHGSNAIQERQEQILKLLQLPTMKDDVGFLFKKMSTMPAARRMSIMPGISIKDDEATPISASLRKSSIAATKTMEPMKAGGKSTGTAFLDLID